MQWSDQELLERTCARDYRAIARLITLTENRVPRARKLQAELFKRSGKAHVIGVTGSPGAGKSTLVDQLARHFRLAGKHVAIVAIDPTSPFSGGAVLGDRIRMNKTLEDREVFIRSMATRGALGGLSRATLDCLQILDGAGFDIVLVETVGVGQGEVDIVRTADTCLVVMVPGMGDSVQAIKAGILEIADVFVINKADRDGADQLQRDLHMLLGLTEHGPGDWLPPIVRSVATTGEGADDIVTRVGEHLAWLRNSSRGEERRRILIRTQILNLAADLTRDELLGPKRDLLEELTKACVARTVDPYTAVEKLTKAP